MKIAKAIELYLDYNRLNSQKKIQADLMGPCYQSFTAILLIEPGLNLT
jgi:hypothetical protein